MTKLLLPNRLGTGSLHPWLEAWERQRDEPHLELVVPEDAFLEPLGIAWLAAGIAERQTRGHESVLVREQPEQDNWRYLQRIDFFHALGIASDEPFQRQAAAGRFAILKRIESLAIASSLAEDLAAVVAAGIPDLAPSVVRALRFACEEIGANTVQHSGAPDTGFGMAQAFPNLAVVRFAFADRGVGFARSLRRNPEWTAYVEDDCAALQLALEKGITGSTDARKNMGIGLSFLRDFVERTRGTLWLCSGDALLVRRPSPSGPSVSTISRVPHWEGSWLAVELPIA